jgi:hypothetical protein
MNPKQAMRLDAWQRHAEVVAATPGVVDIGVGRDAVRVTGLCGEEISDAVVEVLHELVDGGANAIVLHLPAGAVTPTPVASAGLLGGRRG